MKDETEAIMKRLRPKKQLSRDFTAQTMDKIDAPKSHRLSFLLLRRAPALLAVGFVLLISGGAYAATHWKEITAKFSGETVLDSGDHVIGVDLNNCNYFQVPPGKFIDTHEKVYYEINKDSKLSNDQIIDTVLGVCEEQRDNSYLNNLMQPYVKASESKVTSSLAFNIVSANNNSLVVRSDKVYESLSGLGDKELTFNDLSSTLQVYDGQDKITYSDLKADDTILMLAKDNHSGSTPGSNWSEPRFFTVLAIVRVPEFKGDPSAFYTHLGTDFVRTEPCKDNPKQFCRAYEFSPSPKA